MEHREFEGKRIVSVVENYNEVIIKFDDGTKMVIVFSVFSDGEFDIDFSLNQQTVINSSFAGAKSLKIRRY